MIIGVRVWAFNLMALLNMDRGIVQANTEKPIGVTRVTIPIRTGVIGVETDGLLACMRSVIARSRLCDVHRRLNLPSATTITNAPATGYALTLRVRRPAQQIVIARIMICVG